MKKNEIFALTLIRNVGQGTVASVVNYMIENSIESIQDINIDDLISNIRYGKAKKALQENLEWDTFQHYISEADIAIEETESKGITIVAIFEDMYPPLLKLTKSAPIFLYCKGNLSLLSSINNVAVVGTRENTDHGKVITEKTVSFLCENDYTIVSGLALGIDTIAHEQALKAKGNTIAVLVDVDNIQPASNRDLAQRIIQAGGLLIAEENPGIRIIPSMFAKRDRIQSGMSLAVFPIETSKDGGTMHAVKSAKEENRLIYIPDTTKSGYADTNIKQLEGLKYLIEEKIAIPYTRNLYQEIILQLKKKEAELNSPPLKKNQQTQDLGLFG